MMRDISDKQQLMDLLDELQDVVDDERFRVNDLFQRIRDAVPRPMTLVFEKHGDFFDCTTPVGRYCYAKAGEEWIGAPNDGDPCSESETECVKKLQSHFNAAWESMTAKGAAT